MKTGPTDGINRIFTLANCAGFSFFDPINCLILDLKRVAETNKYNCLKMSEMFYEDALCLKSFDIIKL
jgi:hypothetical protein